MKIPRELMVYSFKDFCIRCDDLYDFFWEHYAPFNDIAIYRDYLLFDVFFSKSEFRQEMFAGACWEYLMGDLNTQQLFDICWKEARKG